MLIRRLGAQCFVLSLACGSPAAPVDGGPGSDGGSMQGDAGNGDGELSIGPTFTDAPEYAVPADAPEGTLDSFDLSSDACTHFMTDVATGTVFGRAVTVWIPAQYTGASAAPFIVLQDGSDYVSQLTPVLQTMIHQGRLPAIVVIAIDAGPGGAEGERSLEYDTLSDEYLRFVEDDVLPQVQSHFGVMLTTDPEGRAAMGGSSGGAAAFTMGWFHPELYHRILTYSGTFVNQHPDAMYPHGAWEYHEHLIAESEVKPLRVFLEAGENDFNWNSGTDVYHGWLEANRAMAAVLAARGYHYRFVYAAGADHVDPRAIRETLPSALEWLWRGYAIP